MSEYNCPKCRCGCMFEEKNKLICLNCGAEVPAFAAKGVRHSHHYHTYTAGSGNKPVCVKPAPAPSRSAPFPRRPVAPNGGAPVKPQAARKRGKGCGFWILLYFALFWLVPTLIELISDLF